MCPIARTRAPCAHGRCLAFAHSAHMDGWRIMLQHYCVLYRSSISARVMHFTTCIFATNTQRFRAAAAASKSADAEEAHACTSSTFLRRHRLPSSLHAICICHTRSITLCAAERVQCGRSQPINMHNAVGGGGGPKRISCKCSLAFVIWHATRIWHPHCARATRTTVIIIGMN